MAVQPAVGLLSPSRHSANPPLPSSWLGSWEETAIPINHKTSWLNPSSYFAQLQPEAKAVLQTALSLRSSCAHKAKRRTGSSSMLNLRLVLGFPPACHHSLTLPRVRFVRIRGEAENFHQALKEPVKSVTEHLQGWVRKDGPHSHAVDSLLHALGKGYAGISSTSPELFRKLKTKIPRTFLCFYS